MTGMGAPPPSVIERGAQRRVGMLVRSSGGDYAPGVRKSGLRVRSLSEERSDESKCCRGAPGCFARSIRTTGCECDLGSGRFDSLRSLNVRGDSHAPPTGLSDGHGAEPLTSTPADLVSREACAVLLHTAVTRGHAFRLATARSMTGMSVTPLGASCEERSDETMCRHPRALMNRPEPTMTHGASASTRCAPSTSGGWRCLSGTSLISTQTSVVSRETCAALMQDQIISERDHFDLLSLTQ